MKRFTVVSALLIVCVLVFSVIIEASAASPVVSKSDHTPNHSVCVPALVSIAEVRIAPVFDATGAVVSDPTGTLLSANPSGDVAVLVTCPDVKIAPVFDATGAIVSDPTGTILSVINP